MNSLRRVVYTDAVMNRVSDDECVSANESLAREWRGLTRIFCSLRILARNVGIRIVDALVLNRLSFCHFFYFFFFLLFERQFASAFIA